MVLKVEDKYKMLRIECAAGFASDVLYTLSAIDKTVAESEGLCIIRIDMKYINQCNSALAKFKNKVTFHSSFKEWNENYRNKLPVLIRVSTINTRIYGTKDFKIPHNAIEEATRYFFKPAVNMNSYKNKEWDGYVNLYKKYLHQFPTGLLDRVLKVLDDKNIIYYIEKMYDDSPVKQFDWKPIKLFEPSEDQLEAVEACLKDKRGVVKAATGFGKTAMLARYVTAHYGVPTLFIANKKVLLDDAKQDFLNGIDGLYEADIAQIKDGKFGDLNLRKKDSYTQQDIEDSLNNKKVIVATIQSLHARLNDKKTKYALIHWLHDVCKFVMIDESQAINDKQWQDVLNEVRAPYRIALSATPRRTDGGTLLIHAQTGPLIYETTAAEQIEKGRLCELNINYYPFDHKMYNDNDSELIYTEVYNDSIVNNRKRNEFLADRALEMINEDRQVLMLIQFIEHGYILRDLLLEKGLDPGEIQYIYGGTTDKNRTKAITEFRKGEYKVLIGSTVADAGLNIPSIAGVVLCGAGNSDITHIQRIGRGSRTFDYEKEWGFIPKFIKDSNGEKVTKIVDIIDRNVAFFSKQCKNRYYNACDEFGANRVHIVGADKSVFKIRSKKSYNRSGVDDTEKINELFSVFNESDVEQIKQTQPSDNIEVDNFLCNFNWDV